MTNDYSKGVYAPCPCGSGKKFKWCCYNITTERSRLIQRLLEDPIAMAKYVKQVKEARHANEVQEASEADESGGSQPDLR